MSKAICVMGNPGQGKTTSMRNLDPKETFYVDCDGKGLSWKGWKKQYNKENRNYFRSDNPNTIIELLNKIDKEQPHIKYVVIDTINGIMIGDEMRRMKETNFDKWRDLSQCVYYIVHDSNTLREDLTVVLVAHIQIEEDGFTRILTNGKKLNKIQLESMLTTVLLAKRNEEGEYIFETTSKNSTAKTPMGAFEEEEIPNDITLVIKALEDF